MSTMILPDGVKLYNPIASTKAICLLEMEMHKMSQAIRRKTDWQVKIWQDSVVSKWRNEAIAQGMREEAVNYVFEQVKYFSTICEGGIEPGPVEASWICDELIDEDLNSKFQMLVKVLEDIPASEKDYHPGSDDLVVDLVHPALYCYVVGESLLTDENSISVDFLPQKKPDDGIPIHREYIETSIPRSKHRWMPADVECDENGGIKFCSYINNLNPTEHKELYKIIEKIMEKFIPMFNRCLTDVTVWKGSIIGMSKYSFYDHKDTFVYDENEEWNEETNRKYEEWQRNRKFLPITVPEFKIPEYNQIQIDLKGHRLQVIVKIANIELTPVKPKYEGGSWHVEGMAEERIVATGIYYWDMENITESKLTFRKLIQDPYYEQNDERGVDEIYGLKNHDKLNQVAGDLEAKRGRCLVFPNIYQHRVQPFELIDKTKRGFRKILVYFLIDPTCSIVSTRNVAPQQETWNDVKQKSRKTMTKEDALKYREKLMFERKFVQDKISEVFYEREFYLCEH